MIQIVVIVVLVAAVLVVMWLQYRPVICPKCGERALHAASDWGNVLYHCRACGKPVWDDELRRFEEQRKKNA